VVVDKRGGLGVEQLPSFGLRKKFGTKQKRESREITQMHAQEIKSTWQNAT